jgi:hypothetical protein
MRRRSSGGSAAEEEGQDPVLTSNASEGEGVHPEETPKDPSGTQQSDTQRIIHELDRRKSSIARSRRPSNTNWKPTDSRNGSLDKKSAQSDLSVITMPSKEAHITDKMPESRRTSRLRSPWSISLFTIFTTGLALLVLASIVHSFSSRQLDTKGCRMSYMRPSFAKLSDFDTEHTRFASKYSVYLYREGMVDEDTKV